MNVRKPKKTVFKIRTLQKYITKFPETINFEYISSGYVEGPEHKIYAGVVSEDHFKDLKKQFQVATPEEVHNVYGVIYDTPKTGQKITIAVWQSKQIW